MAELARHASGLLAREQSLLLIVDIQSRLLSAMPEQAAGAVVANSRKLLQASGLLDLPVVLTEQYPKGLGHTDSKLIEALPPSARTFDKTAFSACGSDALMQLLRDGGRRQVVIAGQEAHVCVLQTAFELSERGFQVFVVEDAICSRSESHKANALQRLRHAGIGITNYESVVFEWLRDAVHPDFKTLSALIR
jgi:nicotinamidase-related amidase